MVPKAGLEPARVAPPPPQDGVSTNSTTSALNVLLSKPNHPWVCETFETGNSKFECADFAAKHAKVKEVTKNTTTTQPVSFIKKEAGPRLPKIVEEAPPPKAAPTLAPFPC